MHKQIFNLAMLNGNPNVASLDTPKKPEDFLAQFQQIAFGAQPGQAPFAAQYGAPLAGQHQPMQPMPGAGAGISGAQLSQLQSVVMQAQMQSERLNDKLEIATAQLDEKTKELTTVKESVAGLMSQFNTVDPTKLTSVAHLAEVQGKLELADKDKEELTKKADELQLKIDQLTKDIEAKTTELSGLTKEKEALEKKQNNEVALANGADQPPVGDPTPLVAELTPTQAAELAAKGGKPDPQAEFNSKYAELKHKAETLGGSHRRAFDKFCDENLTQVGMVNSQPKSGAPAGSGYGVAAT